MARALADLPLLATMKQAAEVMGPTESQVRALVRAGKLAHVPVGSRIMIPRSAIENYIAQNTVQPCRDETQARVCDSSRSADATTSSGQNAVAAASAARALAIADKLKSPSANSSPRKADPPGRVIPLRSS